MKTKQVLLSELPAFINKLVQKGMHITRCVKNGNTGNAYVLVEYCDMAMMVTIARRVLHNAEWNETRHKDNVIKVDEKQPIMTDRGYGGKKPLMTKYYNPWKGKNASI